MKCVKASFLLLLGHSPASAFTVCPSQHRLPMRGIAIGAAASCAAQPSDVPSVGTSRRRPRSGTISAGVAALGARVLPVIGVATTVVSPLFLPTIGIADEFQERLDKAVQPIRPKSSGLFAIFEVLFLIPVMIVSLVVLTPVILVETLLKDGLPIIAMAAAAQVCAHGSHTCSCIATPPDASLVGHGLQIDTWRTAMTWVGAASVLFIAGVGVLNLIRS